MTSGFYLSVILSSLITIAAIFLYHIRDTYNLSYVAQFAVLFFLSFVCLFLCIEWFVEREQDKIAALKTDEINSLKELEIYRREFLAEVSHELRTPIFAAQGFIHTLIDGAIDDENVRMKFLEKAAKNTDRLSNLVNDLLVISQIEAGEIEMKMRRFKLYDLMTEVIDSLEYKLVNEKKNRNIKCNILANGNEKIQVSADRERINQVLVNLVDNAIKYGNPQGNIQIRLDNLGDKMQVSVSDDGPGIAPEHMEQIFRRFYRIDKSRSRETGGTGLGLSICKHFVEAHGEELLVESEPGKGTTFTFCLKISEKQPYL